MTRFVRFQWAGNGCPKTVLIRLAVSQNVTALLNIRKPQSSDVVNHNAVFEENLKLSIRK